MLSSFLAALFLGVGGATGAYIFPELSLQARKYGGFKAFLPDSCGVEGFGFQVKLPSETSWRTGNGTKLGRLWSWEDRDRALKIGDQLEYSPRVYYRGASYSLPISSWTVPELVEDWVVPELSEPEQECPPEGKDTTDPNKNQPPTTDSSKPSPKPKNDTKRRKGPQPKALLPKIEKEPPPKIDDDDSGDKDDSYEDGPYPPISPPHGHPFQPTVPPQGHPPPSTGPPFSISCNWLDPPGPGLTKEEVLERQLAILQCEMSTFLERTTKLTAQLNKELLDLKKLNYATVARMQRLETLLKTLPRAVPFSYL